MSTKTTVSLEPCTDALKGHARLAKRYAKSKTLLTDVRDAFARCEVIRDQPLAVFCAGSLARMEVGANSDLDLFVTADEADALRSRLFQITLFSDLMKINEQLSFPPFSNDGEYLKVYFMKDMKSRTGSRFDDSENLFTARMLLMLESQPIAHEQIYRKHLGEIMMHYYRDRSAAMRFRPLFLLNDLLRYWRTLCLNYEERRHDPNQPFRKKNINLKFSRMLTVFSLVLPLIADSTERSVDKAVALCTRTPLERFADGLDLLNDSGLSDRWRNILDIYEEFLSWKEEDPVETFLTQQKDVINKHAKTLSTFLHDALTHESIPGELRRNLIL